MIKDANQSEAGTSRHPDHFLAEWREYRGLSQRRLAELIGASNSKISRIEAGETELRPNFAKKLAKFFNVPLVALVTVNPQGEGRQTAEMLDVWGAIDPRKREDALRVLRALANNGSDKKIG